MKLEIEEAEASRQTTGSLLRTNVPFVLATCQRETQVQNSLISFLLFESRRHRVSKVSLQVTVIL